MHDADWLCGARWKADQARRMKPSAFPMWPGVLLCLIGGALWCVSLL